MLESVLSASGSAALYSCVLMCVPRQCTSHSIPSADLPRDRAKPPLFKLHGSNVRAGPLTIILTIRDVTVMMTLKLFVFGRQLLIVLSINRTVLF
jgi:hypothetical protein